VAVVVGRQIASICESQSKCWYGPHNDTLVGGWALVPMGQRCSVGLFSSDTGWMDGRGKAVIGPNAANAGHVETPSRCLPRGFAALFRRVMMMRWKSGAPLPAKHKSKSWRVESFQAPKAPHGCFAVMA
jgi:hypothetical protein